MGSRIAEKSFCDKMRAKAQYSSATLYGAPAPRKRGFYRQVLNAPSGGQAGTVTLPLPEPAGVSFFFG